MDEYKNNVRKLALQILDEGLQPLPVIENHILNSQSVIRHATGSEFAQARMQYQATLDVMLAQQDAHQSGSMAKLIELAATPPQPTTAPAAPSTTPETAPALFMDLFEKFAQSKLRAGSWSPTTERNNRQYASSICNYLETAWGSTDCVNRELEDWENLQDAMIDNGNTAATINKYMSTVKGVLDHTSAKRLGIYELHRLMALKEDGSDRGAYSPEQTAQLIKGSLAKQVDKPEFNQAIIIAALTGMRLNEILGLIPEDYLLEEGKVVGIRVKANHRRQLKTKESARVVPTPCWPKNWQPDTHLFANSAAYRGDSGAISTAYRRYILAFHPEMERDEKGKKLVFHSHRNAAATRMHRAGVMEERVAEVLGHAKKTQSGKTYYETPESMDDIKHLVEPVRLANQILDV